jgi:hypothetical protein
MMEEGLCRGEWAASMAWDVAFEALKASPAYETRRDRAWGALLGPVDVVEVVTGCWCESLEKEVDPTAFTAWGLRALWAPLL